MTPELSILLITAASVGFVHTVLGPDHYLPFIVMARAGGWSRVKTMSITLLCGFGHVASSVALGMIGIAFGLALHRLEFLESFRGNLAAWALIAFGLVYMVWGLKRAFQNKPHTHLHPHADGSLHIHQHSHAGEHAHVHPAKNPSLTPWILFVIFVLGPCEPLIPLLMYPAARHNLFGVGLVSLVFGAVTALTMLGVVFIGTLGLELIPTRRFERFIHAIAGGTIFLSGVAIQFLGL